MLPSYLDDTVENSAEAKPVASSLPSYLQTPSLGAGLRQAAKQGGFVASVKRTVGQGIRGAGQLVADVVPGVSQENPLIEYGQEVIEANPTAVNRLSDIPAQPFTTVKEATGNAVPSVAGMVGIRALGQGITALSPLTGPAAPVVAGLGQAVSWFGPAAIAALPSYGSIREQQMLNEPEAQASAKDKAVAALGAGTVGLIEQRFGPQNWALAAMTKEGRAALAKKFATTTLPGAVGRGVAVGGAIEGAEEIVQNPIEQIAAYQDPTSRENLQDTAFGGVMGAIGGGVLGGGFGGVSYRSPAARDTAQQRLLGNLIKGAQISVTNGVATVAEEGKLPITVKVEDLAKHLAAGGTMDTLTPEQRFGERGALAPGRITAPMGVDEETAGALQFGRKAQRDTFNANMRGLRSAVGSVTTPMESTPQPYDALYESYQPPSMRPDFTGRRAMTPEEQEVVRFEQEARQYNQLSNQRGMRRTAPGVTEAVAPEPPSLQDALASTYSPEQTPRQDYTGRRAMTPEEQEVDQFRRRAALNTFNANMRGMRRTAPGESTVVPPYPTAADAIYSTYQPEAPPRGLRRTAPGTAQALPPAGTEEFIAQQGLRRSAAGTGYALPEEVINAEKIREDAGRVPQGGPPPVGGQGQGRTDLQRPAEEGAAAGVGPMGEEEVRELRRQQAEFGKPPKPAPGKPEAPTIPTTGVKVRFTGAGAGPQVFEVVRREPAQEGDLEGEAFYTVVNQKNGETHVVERADIAPVKGQEKGFAAIAPADEKPLFSIAPTRQARGQLEQVQNELRSFLGAGFDSLVRRGKLEIVPTDPRNVGEAVPGLPIHNGVGTIVGVYYQGKVTLIADRIGKGDAKYVFLHEGGHALLREDKVFSQRRAEILDSFSRMRGTSDSVAAAFKRVPKNTDPANRTEEALMYWLQNPENHKHSLFARIVAAVRAGLRRLGMPMTYLNETELAQMFTKGVREWARGESGAMVGGGGAVYSQAEIVKAAKALYSKLQQVAADKFQGMKAQSVLPFLQKQGVKKDEIEATGVKEWLAAKKPTDKVTQQELSDFVRANAVELEDVVLSDQPKPLTWSTRKGVKYITSSNPNIKIEYLPNGEFILHTPGGSRNLHDTISSAKEEAEEINGRISKGDAQFAQYQEPGAEEGSYREMFVTAPSRQQATPKYKNGEEYYKSGQYAQDYADIGIPWEKLNSYQRKIVEEAYREADSAYMEQERGKWQDGHSDYSDIKNPVVRIRFNTRTDSQGRKVLFIEEIQGPSKDNQQKMPAYLRDNLYNLGVKRILAYAKENGFDGVSWTTGEMQRNRYSEALKKEVDSIGYQKRGEGFYNITVWGKDGNAVWRNQSASREDIENNIGKELLQKIEEGIGRKEGGITYLEDLDLTVGGEGIVRLYDTTFPKMFEAYAKGKVGETTIPKQWTDRILNATLGEQIVIDDGEFQAVPFIPLTDKTPASYPMFSEKEHPPALQALKAKLDETRKRYDKGLVTHKEMNRLQYEYDVARRKFEREQYQKPLFSIADSALETGRTKVTEAARSLANPKSRLHELYVQYASQWLSVTPLITLVQTFGKNISQVADFARHMDAVIVSKNDIVNTSKELYDVAMELAQAGPGEKVFNYAAAVASYNRMTPWLPLMEQDWVPKTGTKEERLKMANVAWKRAGMDKATGLKFHEAHKEAVKAYEALGSDELKDAYVKIVEDLKRIRTREKNNLLAYIEAATENNPDMRAQLMARFNATFNELQGAYWPLARVGDFRLSFTDKDGTPVVKHYTTVAERRQDRDQLIADGVDLATIREDYKDKRTRNETAIPQELMSQLMGAVEAEYLKNVDPNDEAAVTYAREAAQDVVGNMNQIWLRWQPETSALKNSLRRKNVRGFSEDMMRSYLDYMSRHASNIAWTEQGRKIEQDIKSLADDIMEMQKQPGANTDMQRHILNDLRARVQSTREARVGPIASGLGKLGTAYYMTSPSIALVQMSQLGVITLPKLAAQFGWSRATKALAAGTKESMTRAFTRKEIFSDPAVTTVFENIRAVVTDENRQLPQAQNKALGDRLYTKEEILKQIEGLDPYQKQLLALREATARNLLDISAAHEAYELTQGKDPNGIGSKIFRYAMLPMQLSELTSRKAAVLSTFDLANQDGKNFFDAMNDVSAVVNDTLYSYAKEHKGSALQGGGARVLLQFQHYRIMTGIRLTQLFLNSIKGETPEVRASARKEFIGIMGMAGVLGGTMGLPMAGVVFAIMNAMLGDDDEPVDTELIWRNWLRENFGDTLGNVLTTGVPYLAGADISRRVGMGDIFGMQQAPPPGTHGRNLFAWWAVSMLGPVASVGQSWFQGYDEIANKGNYLKGLEVATPKPIRDALKAYRVGTEGLKTSAGKKLLADEAIGVDEVMLLALGFNADEVAQAQAAERSLNKMSAMISERRGKLIRQAARGILEGDTSDAMRAVLEYNRKMPRFGINGGDIRGAMRKMLTGEFGITGPRATSVADQYEIPSYL